jgi:hypothetical protein
MPLGEELIARIRDARRPVPPVPWFMDLDGVLNVIGSVPSDDWGSYEQIEVLGDQDTAVPVIYASMLVRCLNEMVNRRLVEVTWLTTWERRAPLRFAPAVGLQLGDQVVEDPTGISAFWWKFAAVLKRQVVPGDPGWSPFVWTDDQITSDDQARDLLQLPSEHAVVISPDETRGLTPNHLAAVLDAIDHWAARKP